MPIILIYACGNKPSFSARFGPVGWRRLRLSAHFCSLKAFIASTKMWCLQYSHTKFRYLIFLFIPPFPHSYFSKFSRLWSLSRPLARPHRHWLALQAPWLAVQCLWLALQAPWLAFFLASDGHFLPQLRQISGWSQSFLRHDRQCRANHRSTSNKKLLHFQPKNP